MRKAPKAFVSHRTRDRLRLRIPAKRGDGPYFQGLAQALSARPDIDDVRVNPITGSLLVVASQGAETVLGALDEAKELFSLVSDRSAQVSVSHRTIEPLARLNAQIKTLSGGQFGMNDMVFNGMIAIGLWQIIRRGIELPPWYTAFLVAHTIFFRAIRPEARGSDGVAAMH